MSWNDPSEPRRFVDAERLFRALEGAACAPNLYTLATERFRVGTAEPPGLDEVDDEALSALSEDDFIQIPNELANDIERYRYLEQESERVRVELQAVFRQTKTVSVQLRHADRELESGVGFLKSKATRWEQESRRDKIAAELTELSLKRRRLESDLERAATLLRDLLDRIHRDQRLREAHWFWGQPVIVTFHGHFLMDYLGEMNPANFRGRSLAEILEIGPALA